MTGTIEAGRSAVWATAAGQHRAPGDDGRLSVRLKAERCPADGGARNQLIQLISKWPAVTQGNI